MRSERARGGLEPRAGFTLLELVIVVAIVSILAAAALPVSHWSVKRSKELELRHALRTLRTAIDAYHDAAVLQLIEADVEEGGYPESLDVLIEGVEQKIGDDEEPRGSDRRDEPRLVRFLRRVPFDPMTGRAEWGLRCYEDSPDDRSWCGDNVFDVFSLDPGTAIDGSKYSDW